MQRAQQIRTIVPCKLLLHHCCCAQAERGRRISGQARSVVRDASNVDMQVVVICFPNAVGARLISVKLVIPQRTLLIDFSQPLRVGLARVLANAIS